MEITERIKQATAAIREKTSQKPAIGLVLGSGLGILPSSWKAAQ